MFLDVDSLSLNVLDDIFKGDLLSIRVRDFIDLKTAKILSEKILSKGSDKYINAPSIGRIGMAFYETDGNKIRISDYFDSSSRNIVDLRRRCYPYASPIDVLRCNFDEIWPAGAKLETLYGKKMFVGLSRVVDPGVEMLAHHDIFSKDAPDSFHAQSLLSQVAANVYLSMPSEGGKIQIWDRYIEPEEFDNMRGNSYGIDPKKLGKPSLEISPKVGDLILFNANKMHSVTAGNDHIRLSLSCFVGYRGSSLPLSFWS